MLADLKKKFTVGLSSKFATRLVSYFPLHLKCVITLLLHKRFAYLLKDYKWLIVTEIILEMYSLLCWHHLSWLTTWFDWHENWIMHECIIAREYQCVELCLNYVRMLVTPNLSLKVSHMNLMWLFAPKPVSCKRAQITYFAIIITNIIVTHRNAR